MFISQVTFEIAQENEAMLLGIMKNKLASAQGAAGAVSAECWKNTSGDNVAYSLVVHWENQDQFKAWMASEHKPGNGGERPAPSGVRPSMKRSGTQYETVTFD